MQIGTKEHDEMINNFENHYKHERLDKENKELWEKGNIYQDGEVNKLFITFRIGYSFGRVKYMNA